MNPKQSYLEDLITCFTQSVFTDLVILKQTIIFPES